MKTKGLFILAAVFALTFSSCEKEDALTENPEFIPTATGDDPSGGNPNGGGTGGGTGGGGNGGGTGGGGSSLTVEQTQRATVTYVGATWCGPCGANGDPAKEHMEDTHGSNVVILNVQSGDAISASGAFGPEFGNVFQTFVSSNSIPHAYWSGANFAMVHRGFYSDASANNSAADGDINTIMANNPDVGVAAKATIVEDTITIETLSKFYVASSEMHIGVYLLEDGVEANQTISGSPSAVTSHENVMRGAAYTGNTLGIESMGSSFTENQEVTGSYTIVVPGTVLDKTKLQIAVVVWESSDADGISNSVLVDVE